MPFDSKAHTRFIGGSVIMLVSTKEMLQKAYEGHYAVGAFNVENLEFVMEPYAVRLMRLKPKLVILIWINGTTYIKTPR